MSGAAAIARLMRDALEVETCSNLSGVQVHAHPAARVISLPLLDACPVPLPAVCLISIMVRHLSRQAAPLEGNIFEWHANICLPSEVDTSSVLHLILTFDEHYPSTPPTVLCTVRFPHANCYRKPDGTYTICLDMLEPPTKKGSPYSGWSSAMSVLSILLQLQSFLTLKKLHYAEGMGSMQHAMDAMDKFVCPAAGCSHRGSADPWPAPRERATHDAPRRLVCRPCGTVGFAGADANPYAPTQVALPPSMAAHASTISSSADNKSFPPAPKANYSTGNKFAVLTAADLNDEPSSTLPSAAASATIANTIPTSITSTSGISTTTTECSVSTSAYTPAYTPALTPLSAGPSRPSGSLAWDERATMHPSTRRSAVTLSHTRQSREACRVVLGWTVVRVLLRAMSSQLPITRTRRVGADVDEV